jgi:hypothetical protein
MSDEDYIKNGSPERHFYPVSHTNVSAWQGWDTPYEFALLRSHAVADDIARELAEALRLCVVPSRSGAYELRLRALARYERVMG